MRATKDNFFEAIEPRQMLASTATFTDVDGDIYRVDVLGNGTAVVTTSLGGTSGFIDTLTLSGTDVKSTLRVKLLTKAGDGRIGLNTFSGPIVGTVDMGIVDLRETGLFGLFDVGTLVLGDVAGNSDISIDDDAADEISTRKASFRDVGVAGITLVGFQQSVTFRSFDNGSLYLSRGAKTISSQGVLIIALNTNVFSAASGIGSITAKGDARLNGNVLCSIGSIRAASFLQPNASNALALSGTLGSLKSTGNNAGRFSAKNFGPVSGADFSGTLGAYEPTAAGVSFASVKFIGAVTGDITVPQTPQSDPGVPGRIVSLSCGSVSGMTLDAESLGAFKVGGSVTGLEMHLTRATGLAINAMTVKGGLSNSQITTAPAAGFGALTLISMSGSTVDTGFITALTFKPGTNSGASFAGFDFRGADAEGFACKTAKLGDRFENAYLSNVSGATGRFGTVTGRVFDHADITAATIGSVTATGVPGVFGDVMTNSGIRATVSPPTGPAIGTIDLRGRVQSTDIVAAGSIDRVQLGELPATDEETRVSAGLIGGPFLDFPADLNAFSPIARIGKIVISRAFSAGTPSFSGGVFVAPAMGDITLNGLINTTGLNDGSGAFGFAARTFGKVTLKNATGQTIKPVIPTSPGAFNPFAPTDAGNFEFLVYA